MFWIWRKVPYLAGVGKQANEVWNKQKLSLKASQEQVIMSMNPSQNLQLSPARAARWGSQGGLRLCPVAMNWVWNATERDCGQQQAQLVPSSSAAHRCHYGPSSGLFAAFPWLLLFSKHLFTSRIQGFIPSVTGQKAKGPGYTVLGIWEEQQQ